MPDYVLRFLRAAGPITLCSVMLLAACDLETTGHQGVLETEQVTDSLSLMSIRSSTNFVTYGDVITLSSYISFDGGEKWEPHSAYYSGAMGQWTHKRLVAPGVMYFYDTKMGAGILHMDERRIEKISDTSEIELHYLDVRYDPATKTVYGYRRNANVQRYRNGAWESVPVPTTAMRDLAINEEGIFAIVHNAMYRSLDDAASFETIDGLGGTEITPLPDGRLILDDEILSPIGERTGKKINYPLEHGWSAKNLSFCNDGSWVHGIYQSKDDGESWESIFEDGDPYGEWGETEYARCENGRWYFYISVGIDGPGTTGYVATADSPNEPMRWVQADLDARPEGMLGLYNPVQLGKDHYGIWGVPAWWDPDARVWRPQFMTGKVHRIQSGRLVQTLAGMHRISKDGGRTWENIEPLPGYPTIQGLYEYPDGRWVADFTFQEEIFPGTIQITATHFVSADEGRVWTQAYQGVKIIERTGEETGEAHTLVGVTRDGVLVSATSYSDDEGRTWKKFPLDESQKEYVILGSHSGLLITHLWEVGIGRRLGVRPNLGQSGLREYELGDASEIIEFLQFPLMAIDDDDRLVFYHDGLRRSRGRL